MDFKTTVNKTTNKKTYFIDNKRVSFDKFDEKQIICKLKGLSYNSSLTISNKKYIYHYFSFN